MKESKNNQTKSTSKTKTPQWIRDVATSANINDEMTSPNVSSAILSDNRFNKRKINTNKTRQTPSNIPDIKFKPSNKIKKIHQKLVSIEEHKKKDTLNEDKVEKTLEQDESRIDKLLNDRFN